MIAAVAVPYQYNPMPMFGLRPRRCRECGLVLLPEDNRIVHLGGGVLAKFGLCQFCLNEEMRQREEYDPVSDEQDIIEREDQTVRRLFAALRREEAERELDKKRAYNERWANGEML